MVTELLRDVWTEVDHELPKEICKVLTSFAVQSPDAEICGFILEDGTICPIPNVYENPRYGFEMDKKEMMKVIHGRISILGTYHSHPSNNPHPSLRDNEIMSYLYQQGCPWRYFTITPAGVYEFQHKVKQT